MGWIELYKTYVIAINAISGGGKTTVTQYLKDNLHNAEALYFDDREYDIDSGIIDICKWMDEGEEGAKRKQEKYLKA